MALKVSKGDISARLVSLCSTTPCAMPHMHALPGLCETSTESTGRGALAWRTPGTKYAAVRLGAQRPVYQVQDR